MKKSILLDIDCCVGCCACAVACMDQNDSFPEKGAQAFRRIYQVEEGCEQIRYVSLACRHCEDNPCVIACPTGAVSKDDESGSVTINRDLCIGCHSCALSCPFGIPRYDAEGKMQKCGLCAERVEEGMEPACVRVCPMGALRFDDINLMQQERESQAVRNIISASGQSQGKMHP